MTEIQAKLTFILDLQEQLFRKTRGVLDRHWAAVKGLDLASQVLPSQSVEYSWSVYIRYIRHGLL